jgi:hypothetical protein
VRSVYLSADIAEMVFVATSVQLYSYNTGIHTSSGDILQYRQRYRYIHTCIRSQYNIAHNLVSRRDLLHIKTICVSDSYLFKVSCTDKFRRKSGYSHISKKIRKIAKICEQPDTSYFERLTWEQVGFCCTHAKHRGTSDCCTCTCTPAAYSSTIDQCLQKQYSCCGL